MVPLTSIYAAIPSAISSACSKTVWVAMLAQDGWDSDPLDMAHFNYRFSFCLVFPWCPDVG